GSNCENVFEKNVFESKVPVPDGHVNGTTTVSAFALAGKTQQAATAKQRSTFITVPSPSICAPGGSVAFLKFHRQPLIFWTGVVAKTGTALFQNVTEM